MKYAIYAGLGGSFGGANYQFSGDFDTEEDALGTARIMAIEEYESYEGNYGLPNWEEVKEELIESYGPDEEVSDGDVQEVYLNYIDGWIDYYVEEVSDEEDENDE